MIAIRSREVKKTLTDESCGSRFLSPASDAGKETEMTHYAAKLSKRPLTTDETSLAEQYIKGAQAAGFKVTRENVTAIFPPACSDLVMRYLRGC